MAKSKIILLDSDVISHFMSTAKIDVLPKILSPNYLYIVDDVYRESIHHPIFEDRKQELDNWISKNKIQRIAFPWNNSLCPRAVSSKTARLAAGDNVGSNKLNVYGIFCITFRPLCLRLLPFALLQ